MEDVKWLLRRCGLPILLLLILVIVGVFCWRKMHAEKQKVVEEVWEPPVEIENSDAETEEVENTETSTDSAYWFIPQASDDLLSEEEKEHENATKHNAVSPSKPLNVSVVSDGQTVTVSNNLIPRVTEAQSSGLGLNYIRQQYRDRSGKGIEIIRTDDFYTVKLPLL